MRAKHRREAQIRMKAQWFADSITEFKQPREITASLLEFLKDGNELARFERYMHYLGFFKRHDNKWDKRRD